MKYLSVIFLLFSLNWDSVYAQFDHYDSLEINTVKLITKGQLQKANRFRDSICEIGKKQDDKILLFFCHFLSARLLTNQQDEGVRKCLYALEYGKQNTIHPRYFIYPYIKLANLYSKAENYNTALGYLHLANEIAKDNKVDFLLGKILNLQSLVSLNIGDTLSSLKFQEELLDRYSDVMSEKHLALYKFDFFYLKSNIDSALWHGNKYLNSKKNKNKNLIVPEVSNKMGDLLLIKNDTTNAKKYFERAFNASQKIKDYINSEYSSKKLAFICLNLGDSEKAKYYSKININLKDSLIGILEKTKIEKIANQEKETQIIRIIKNQYLSYLYSIIIITVLLITIILFYTYQKRNTTIEIRKKTNSNYPKFQIPEKEIKIIENKLQLFIEQQLFLEKKCNTGFVVRKLKLKNERYLSEYIKLKYNKSFSDFINELRINYICEILKKNKYVRQYSIEHITTEAGFLSRSTFSRCFKKQVGVSPSDYINSL